MLACPKCGSEQIHPSKRKGLIERKLLSAFLVRPFRCEFCDFRFFHWSPSANSSSLQSVGKGFHFNHDANAGTSHKA